MRDDSRRFTLIILVIVIFASLLSGVLFFLWLESEADPPPARRADGQRSEAPPSEPASKRIHDRDLDPTKPAEHTSPARPREPFAPPPDPADFVDPSPGSEGVDSEGAVPPALEWAKMSRLRLVVPIELSVGGVNLESLGGGARAARVAFDPNMIANEQRALFDHPELLRMSEFRIEIVKQSAEAGLAEVLFTNGPPGGSHLLEVQLHFHAQVEGLPSQVRDDLLQLLDRFAAGRATSGGPIAWRLRQGEGAEAVRTPLQLRSVDREPRSMDVARIEFSPVTVDVTARRNPRDLVVSGRFVTPMGGHPVMVPEAWMQWSGVRTDADSIRLAMVYGRPNGAFVGLLRLRDEDGFPSAGTAAGFSLCASNPTRKARVPEDPESLANPHFPLAAARVSSGAVDFGEIPWPGHLLLIRVDRESEVFRASGLPVDAPVVVELRPFGRALPILTDTGEGAHFLGVPITSRGTNVSASVRDARWLRYRSVSAAKLPTRSGEEEVVVSPDWERVLRVHLTHGGRALTRGLVIALPANTPELQEAAARGRYPEWIERTLRGYGTIPDAQLDTLPVLVPISTERGPIPGHWIVATVDGVGTAIKWLPIDQTGDITLELGSVGPARRVAIVATMPALTEGSIPGAAVAREQGWRGGLWFTLRGTPIEESSARDPKAIEEALDQSMHLCDLRLDESGTSRGFAHLDPSQLWVFRVQLASKSEVFLPLYDHITVFQSQPLRIDGTGDDPAATLEINIGEIPPPRLVAKLARREGGQLASYVWRCEGEEVRAVGAGYSYMSGAYWDGSTGIPPAYDDGKDVVRFSYVLPPDPTHSLRAEIDLPVRALVHASWGADERYELEVFLPQRGMRPPIRLRTPQIENGKITRVYAPTGEVEFRLVRPMGHAAGPLVKAVKATVTDRSPVSVAISVP